MHTVTMFHELAAAFASQTGGHACGFIVCGDIKDTTKPTFFGDNLCKQFFEEVMKIGLAAFAQNLEAFCMSGGAKGLAESTHKHMLALKAYICAMLNERLHK
ncbi:hypothetical protein DACRYDRAFT_107664 [Dacryopinax primogenitus]|uniref:Uncharacterized protein n=1 Tax=Dacryopinax primogenitus (strain DJM 731) TaxID=1858805 RepID=M5G7S2_DACPD|nr:uncharacterized protein DACRYDRAFT_107664 [Dacryopinax primogenitus]EJU01932.1 hypothetical protein DACRYDRAFT_107664 [Dacryopinax primogenitus]